MRVEYREEPCRSALNKVRGMPYFAWTLNPYMGCVHRCTFCYVRAYERRADRPSGEAYGASIRVKVNVADVLRTELARRTWQGESVALGTATDPYQPAEGRYRLTRACLGVLADAENPFSIVTRGPLIVRDVDVLADAAARTQVGVSFSVPTLDEEVWRRTEPGTAPPRQRLRALEQLRSAGIDAGVAVAPVLPGISDSEEQLRDVGRGRAGGGRDARLGEHPSPAAGHARALPRAPRGGLARARAVLRAALRANGVRAEGDTGDDRRQGGRAPQRHAWTPVARHAPAGAEGAADAHLALRE